MTTKKIVDDFDWENNTWDVIDTFFKQDSVLINHHLKSFNYFLVKYILVSQYYMTNQINTCILMMLV